MGEGFIFDQPPYAALNVARERVIERLIASLRKDCRLETAADLGCGLGYFSAFLRRFGFRVIGVDGREENVDEAKRRFPDIEFHRMDAEDPRIREFGQFDLVLCIGLYYHLENPFAAFRNCFAMTKQIAIVEGMCVPGKEARLEVRDEGPTEDQGLHHVALYPSENGLVKLLYRSGYPFVYRFRAMPEHPNYADSSLARQSRTIVVAARSELASELLTPAAEPVTKDPWTRRNTPAALALYTRDAAIRFGRFLGKPWPEKQKVLSRRWGRLFPS